MVLFSCEYHYKAVLGNIRNKLRFSKLILLTYLEHITNILMCFFLGKFISEIHKYSQKSEKFISS